MELNTEKKLFISRPPRFPLPDWRLRDFLPEGEPPLLALYRFFAAARDLGRKHRKLTKKKGTR